MIIKIRKMLLCLLAIQILFITLSTISYAATCSNNWRRVSSQTMETEIMSASMTEYANGERYFSIKQGWKTTYVYYLHGALLVKGLDDNEINYNNIFWFPMVFTQGGVLSKAFPQGHCSITQKTQIALTEAEGEVVPASQGIIAYNYTLTGKQNVKHFKGVMSFTPQDAAPSEDTVVKDFKIVGQSKPYTVIGSNDMPVTTLGELRRALIEKKNSSKKWTGPIPEIVMAPAKKEETETLKELYPVSFEQTYVFVDRKGQVIVEAPCRIIEEFDDDIAICTNFLKSGYINREGKIIVEPKYSTQECVGFSEGLTTLKENGTVGYVDKTGHFVIKPQFESSLLFHEGFAAAQSDKKWGFIDKTGKFVIKPQFESSRSFYEGLAATQKDGKWGFIDKIGKFVIEPKFDHVRVFHEDMASVANTINRKKWFGFINKKGGFIIEPQFEDAGDFKNGIAAVKKKGEWGFIDKTGKIVIEPQFEQVVSFIEESAIVKKNGMYFLIDKSGNRISKEYEWMTYAGDNMIMISNNRQYGFMNISGQIIVNPQFDDVRYHGRFSEGLAAVKKDGKKGYINKTGQFIIEPQFEVAGPFKNGVARATKYGQFYWIDKTGNIFVIKDTVCGHDVVKNSKGEITWPRNIKDLCGKSN